ncbi:YegP family protein [Segeticoccus rhizosphaerae]|uniref:YegP family protein n=1 Tax=Segeticoccus rhizosphaerae TaxID=1104777 RepID=UPI0013967B89|nr:YegP family protein [Segeticoccus rhizosphaerae]
MKRRARFEIFPSADGWRWRLIASNQLIVAQSEGYSTKSNAKRACTGVLRAAMNAHLSDEPIREAAS